MAPRNPFTPSFGKVPAHLAGRSQILSAMSGAFESGVGDPNLCTILVGARGTGKTALLSSIARDASSRGWIAAEASATPGMLEDIEQRAIRNASEFVERRSGTRLSGLSVGQLLGIEVEHAPEPKLNWRSRMDLLLDALEESGVGLLMTVDEVRADVPEMIQLASVYQHFVREDRKVALVMAGLPFHVTSLIGDESVSFLRRARQRRVGRVSDADVENALLATVTEAGRAIDDDALLAAVRATEGFPYMMQLVGYGMWEACQTDVIVLADVERGARQARSEMESGVLAMSYRDLSRGDKRFLAALISAGEGATLADIAHVMGVRSNYASQYKARMLSAGVIGERTDGSFGFDLPGFREYFARNEALSIR